MERFNTELDEGEYASILMDPIELVRSFQCYGPDGSFQLFDDKVDGLWANASDDVPLLRQLLIDPRIIVDLKPVQNENECIQAYGVTSSQLVKLVRRGFVAINLYAYESGKGSDFSAYQSSECIGFPELLDFDKSKCRINSIRKESFFNRILKEEGLIYSDLIREYKEKVTWLFDHITDEQRFKLIKRNILRSGDIDGNIETLTQQLAYNYSSMLAVNRSGDSDRYFDIKKIVEKIELQLTVPEKVSDTFLKIRGLKNCISTPYTASMGGIYNMSSGAVKSLYNVIQINSKIQENDPLYKKREEHKEIKSILEFIEGTSKRFSQSDQIQDPGLFENELSSAFFEDYLEFIYLMRESTFKLNQTLNDLTKQNSLYNNYVRTGATYFDIEEDIQNELKKYKKFRGILAYGLSGILTATTGLPDITSNFIGFGLGSVVEGASKESVQSMRVDRLIASDNRRILANLSEFRKIATI